MDPAEIRRRLRAARAYAGFSQQQLADELGVHRDTVKRLESEDGSALPAGWRLEALLDRIAVCCGLPPSFFRIDFGTGEIPPVP